MPEQDAQRHFNSLSPATDERLAWMLEEMGEALQEIGKTQRHGFDSRNPLAPNSPTNRQALERELGHVLAAIHLLAESGDVSYSDIVGHKLNKAESVKRWMHHQEF